MQDVDLLTRRSISRYIKGPMYVMKFGGSSVADSGRIDRVASIVATVAEGVQSAASGAGAVGGAVGQRNALPVVVLSALKGATDELIQASREATDGNAAYRSRIDELERRHRDVAMTLVEDTSAVLEALEARFQELRGILHGVELVRECTWRTADLITSFGELLSCELFEAVLRSRGVRATMVDPRSVILTDGNHGSARVNRPVTYERMRERWLERDDVYVVPGFIAATASGVTTTLGRNGSDYTASLIGAGLGAERVEIWTDVDGVLSANPSSVPDAFVIDHMSFEEAAELSYFGAEVLHPSSMLPVIELDIPVVIRNTLNPEARGTRISSEPSGSELVTGIASIDQVSILNVEGAGMVGMPGVAARIFSAIARAGVNVLMISQASSEHTICLVFRSPDIPAAVAELERELAPELASREIEPFDIQENMEIVAVIGEGMRGRFGVSGRLFDALGRAGISVHAIAQGSSERNISFVVAGEDSKHTLGTVHSAFFRPSDSWNRSA